MCWKSKATIERLAALTLGFLLWGLAPATGQLLPPMTGAPQDFAPRRSGAEVGAVHRIAITNEGLYRLDHATLVAAGFTNPVGAELRMYCRTQEVALYVSSAGPWTASDFLLFYGWGHDGYYTSTNVYWLGQGGAGLRMSAEDAAPKPLAPEVTATWHRVRFDRDVLFLRNTRPTDTNFDHWAYGLLNMTQALAVTLSTTGRVPDGAAQLEATLIGVTDVPAVNPDHRTRVRINGVVVTTNFTFDADERCFVSTSFSASLLSNGLTTVDFLQIQTGVPDDRAVLEEFTIGYNRQLVASDDRLIFNGEPGTNNYVVRALPSGQPIWALDVTSPSSPILLTNCFVSNAVARFGAARAATNRFFVCATSAVQVIGQVERVVFRNLANTNRQADFIAICPYEFRRGTYELLKHRYRTGLNVAVAPITDIYNEFSYGIKDAAAIKQFIGYAFHHWRSPPPRYVLLIGDGSYDPKNNKNLTNNVDWIPVHLGPSAFDWASQDGWFATVNGSDWLADVALGRLPVVTAAQLTGVVAKIVAYDGLAKTNAWRKKALLVADKKDSALDFKAASQLRIDPHLASNGFTRTTAYRDDLSAALVNSTITNAINQRTFVVTYFGHGAPEYWSGEQFFTNADAAGLTNSVWPMFLMLTCRNGQFDDETRVSLSETLLRRPARGAIACVAASGLSIQQAAEYFADGFTAGLVNTTECPRAGDVMNAGFLKLWIASPNQPELLFYSILGDPAQIVNPP